MVLLSLSVAYENRGAIFFSWVVVTTIFLSRWMGEGDPASLQEQRVCQHQV
jgi:hypothetical protein